MAARLSGLAEASGIVARADELGARALGLADEDASAYGRVIAALRLPREPAATRRSAIEEALSLAAGVPSEITGIAHETAVLGAELVASGNPNLRGDAAAGAVLAAAAARAAAVLVRINLAHLPDDARVALSSGLAEAADAAARRAEDAAARP